MNDGAIPVLLVEDNEDHAELVKRTLQAANLPVRITDFKHPHGRHAGPYLHANSYLTKPASFDRFGRMMKDLGRYWTACNTTVAAGVVVRGPRHGS